MKPDLSSKKLEFKSKGGFKPQKRGTLGFKQQTIRV
jgi:hypothetical protein